MENKISCKKITSSHGSALSCTSIQTYPHESVNNEYWSNYNYCITIMKGLGYGKCTCEVAVSQFKDEILIVHGGK